MILVWIILTAITALYAFASWHGLKTWRTGAEMYAAGIAGMVACAWGAVDVVAIVVVAALRT